MLLKLIYEICRKKLYGEKSLLVHHILCCRKKFYFSYCMIAKKLVKNIT